MGVAPLDSNGLTKNVWGWKERLPVDPGIPGRGAAAVEGGREDGRVVGTASAR